MGESYGDFTYTVSSNKVTITSYEGLGGRVDIPATINGLPVIDIGNSFSGSAITEITIPNSVTIIGNGAFQDCRQLVEITIPSSVTSIGNAAFWYCFSLAEITIPNSVSSIGWGAFVGAKITNLIIPNSVSTIEGNAFGGCLELTTVTISSGVTYIGDSAFAHCGKLQKVYFLGNTPSKGAAIFNQSTPTIYYLAQTTGWGPVFAGRPTALAGSYALTVSCDTLKGTISINPNSPYYIAGTTVAVMATPVAGYLFSSWSGSSSALTSSISLTMNQDQALTASFNQDNADSDGDGLTNFQESITYGSDPNLKDSNADGVEDGQAVSMGYSPTLNFSGLLAHPPTGLYTANQMQAMAIGDLVLTKNANGSFTLNYDIEKSDNLQTWTTYQALSLPLTGLPADKAFVRIKAKQNGSGLQSAPTSSTPTTDINNGANWNSQQNTMGPPVEGAPGT
jgi:hypothetical protein